MTAPSVYQHTSFKSGKEDKEGKGRRESRKEVYLSVLVDLFGAAIRGDAALRSNREVGIRERLSGTSALSKDRLKLCHLRRLSLDKKKKPSVKGVD